MRNVPHPPPTRLSSGAATFGIRLNWSRFIDSQGIDGYGWREGFRSLPVSSTGAYVSWSLPRAASSTIFGQVSSAVVVLNLPACPGQGSCQNPSKVQQRGRQSGVRDRAGIRASWRAYWTAGVEHEEAE